MAENSPAAPPRPPRSSLVTDHRRERGIVHEAGAVTGGVQRCRLCGIDLPLPVETEGAWEVGALIAQRLFKNGQTMTCSTSVEAAQFPYCDSRR